MPFAKGKERLDEIEDSFRNWAIHSDRSSNSWVRTLDLAVSFRAQHSHLHDPSSTISS